MRWSPMPTADCHQRLLVPPVAVRQLAPRCCGDLGMTLYRRLDGRLECRLPLARGFWRARGSALLAALGLKPGLLVRSVAVGLVVRVPASAQVALLRAVDGAS